MVSEGTPEWGLVMDWNLILQQLADDPSVSAASYYEQLYNNFTRTWYAADLSMALRHTVERRLHPMVAGQLQTLTKSILNLTAKLEQQQQETE